MSSTLAKTGAAERHYQCPGETYTISHEMHVGRMASFYAKCRACPHRHDIGPLTKRQVARLDELDRRAPRTIYGHEGMQGTGINELSPVEIRKIAAAFGTLLSDTRTINSDGADRASERIVLAADGRMIATQMTFAAAEGLRWAGAHVIELTAATAPALVASIEHHRASGGLLIGNTSGEPHALGIKFWTEGGRPMSSPGTLDALRRSIEQGFDRPGRRYGPIERADGRTEYLDRLRGYYHALRPLRFVVDTPCSLIRRELNELLETVGCQAIYPQDGAPDVESRAAAAQHREDPAEEIATRRQRSLSGKVLQQGADFGVIIDDDGERMDCVDERGRRCPPERLLLLMARADSREPAGQTVVLEEEAESDTVSAFRRQGVDVMHAGATREAMVRAMRDAKAAWGASASGRVYTALHEPTADALLALTLLLAVLSQTDQTLSEALRQALAGSGKQR